MGGGTDSPWKRIWKVCPAEGGFPLLVHGTGEGIDCGQFEEAAVILDILNVIRRTLGLWINFDNSFVSFLKNVLIHQLINKLSSCYLRFPRYYKRPIINSWVVEVSVIFLEM